MSEKKRVPELRFGEFSGEWETSKLENYCIKIASGKSKQEKDGNYNLYGSTGIIGKTNEYSNNGKFILIARVGANAGLTNIVNGKFGVTDNTLVIDLNDNVEIDFILSLLQKYNLNKLIFGSGQPLITGGQLKNLKLAFPSKPEQEKIASFLSSVDRKIEQLSKKKTLLEQYKKGVMQKIFSQELRFKEDDGSEFSEWREEKVSAFMIERNIKTPKSKEYPLMAFVAYKGVTDKGDRYNREFLVNDGDNKKYKQTEYGDFIYSSNNLETGSIGLNRYGSATISPVYSVFQITESCDYKFISTLLKTKSFINKMIRYRQGVVYGQWRIHESHFLNIKVDIPCIQEQTKIATFLSSLDKKIELTDKELNTTKKFKKALLQKMFV